VWCVVCGVWCVVCGVWCVVCGVWCVVCGVWCVVCVLLALCWLATLGRSEFDPVQTGANQGLAKLYQKLYSEGGGAGSDP